MRPDPARTDGGAWDPALYLRYGDERSRPFADLMARVRAVSPAVVVDRGCGEGSLTARLAQRWPGARVTGVDSSAAMLAAARAHARPGRVDFVLQDVRDWRPSGPVDVLVTNAVLQWVPGHERLLVEWRSRLSPGGWLAVQVPGNFGAPTHVLLRELCRSSRWADQVGNVPRGSDVVLEPGGYFDVLTAAGLTVDVWETTYLHVLTGSDPVLAWVRATQLRPVLARLGDDDAAEFTAEYAAALREAYPERPDGTTLLPFRRIFAVGSLPA
ncbi:trans-aconitate methyltransferase [Blastococcus sp. CCUG 61487]|nr:trans-aconitate methyltransferase [Blastococcus sp. CCUG 61487]